MLRKAPRLEHKKSTTGCRRCKARKVKCDEIRPKCSQCARHLVDCEYPALKIQTFTPDKGISKRIRKSQVSERQDVVSPLQRSFLGSIFPVLLSEPESSILLSLRLLHHYLTHTSGTLSMAGDPQVRRMWDITVPEMAFEHKPLLYTLFAVSALHQSKSMLMEHKCWNSHQFYLDLALFQHKKALAESAGPKFESICMTTILISFYTLALRSNMPTGPYEPPMLWLSMSRGIRPVLTQVYDRLTMPGGRLLPLLRAKPVIEHLPDENQLENNAKGTFSFLLHCQADIEYVDQVSMDAYKYGVSYLDVMYLALRNHESEFQIRKRLCAFPPIMTERFLQLLYQRRPRALVILAYLFALVSGADNVWWLRGIPEQEIRGINSIMPAEWRWAMKWPLNVIESGMEMMFHK
ncbi:hypothetical protein BGW36DRAFT_135228 [Talaromyces proteolyticus]|uniref:Zn(2)-C6 fungal-type domain-containing protein n=1 Tax=Talaromyces proteolyticus TaxID=1131652 RepID=A0AAD4KZM1_9EURO|nr:uncharacterized protein BGW36DRAFT_135228 [Talaromyces proteolyticus]KAH8700755.1 hypothetical protein BGW36DRAFT_135228 [Talaromyces proteolyticus]